MVKGQEWGSTLATGCLAGRREERVEREAATEELQGAITAAKESRDASTLSKPIKRAKKVRFGVPGSGGVPGCSHIVDRCIRSPASRAHRQPLATCRQQLALSR